ncbi:arf-GAP domain and FG repeat-containing protein 1-like isoform X2 [Saccostrea echinata]|uniref:arf-GAP domain and FG repeat-containing protein 1-like isoform X2 n=1 Tax=Saccostrea echinata TaxID=191078 RepID=UPI002A7F7383|nr:arf-GAP domain and FG repeat-containing protein 1-like isoform X2 [Saccostrea echinata]
MATKRKQDEKHLKMLRDMAALPHNRQCFDCHQRGPTYLDMTIGSFVCTACSGILRGINPPHRVKSISMASFTPEEIDFIKCHGNEFCRKVWLGLYDSQKDQAEPDSRDEQKIKDFMAQKYERKRWYQAPTEAMKEEARQVNESATNRQVPTRPLKTILGDKTPKLVVQNQSPQTTPKNQAAQQPPPVSQPPASQSFSSPGQQNQSSQSSGSTTMDLLGDLGGDPFASSAPPAPKVATGGGGEDTNTLFPMSNTPISAAPAVNGGFPSFSPAQAPPAAPAGSESSASGGNKYSDLGDLFSAPTTTESNTTALSWGGSTSVSGISWGGGGGSSNSGGIDWNSGGGSGTGVNWNSGGSSSTMGTTMNWNTSCGSTSSMAPSSSAFSIPPSAYSYSQLGRRGNPFFSDSGGANPFGETTAATQSNVSNPFGGSAGGGHSSLFGNQPNAGFGQHSGGFGNQPTSAAGFGTHTSMAGGYGTPTSAVGGFGAQTSVARGFGQPASNPGTFNMGGFGQTSTAGGFGHAPTPGGFGQNPSAGNFGQPGGGFGGAGMSNQFHNQNGVFSSMGPSSTSGGFGTVSQAQTIPNQFGNSMPGQFDNKMGGTHGFPSGWGGQPVATNAQSVNPFLSTAAQSMAPKSGSTNPFL